MEHTAEKELAMGVVDPSSIPQWVPLWEWQSKSSDSPLIKQLLLIRDGLQERTIRLSQAEVMLSDWYASYSRGATKAYEFFQPKGEAKAQVKVVWKAYLMPKHRFTLQLLAHDQLRTKDCISYEPIKISLLCQDVDETIDHLFFGRLTKAHFLPMAYIVFLIWQVRNKCQYEETSLTEINLFIRSR